MVEIANMEVVQLLSSDCLSLLGEARLRLGYALGNDRDRKTTIHQQVLQTKHCLLQQTRLVVTASKNEFLRLS